MLGPHPFLESGLLIRIYESKDIFLSYVFMKNTYFKTEKQTLRYLVNRRQLAHC